MSGPFNRMFHWWKEIDRERNFPSPAPDTRSPTPWIKTIEAAKIPTTLNYPHTTLSRLLDQTADRFADTIALIYSNTQWTYRDLLERVNRLAGGLARLGVRKGDRVVMTLPNCPEYVESFFAIQKLGAVAVNAGPLMGIDDLRTLLAMTTPRVVIGLDLQAATLAHAGEHSTVEHWVWVSLQTYQNVLRRFGYQIKLWQGREHSSLSHQIELPKLMEQAPARPPTIEPSPDAIAVLQPTSGTTGSLKLAQLSHKNLVSNTMQTDIWMDARMGQERVLSVLPMFHVYGLMTCLIEPVFGAAAMILETRFEVDECLELVNRHRPTVFPIVPAICDAISTQIERNDGAEAFKNIRICFSGSAPLSHETAERFHRLTGVTVVEGYGLTEASPVTHCNLPGGSREGSIGLPFPDTLCRVADLDEPSKDAPPGENGELLVSGPQVFSGYFANAEETRKALLTDSAGRTWLRTGDIVNVDPDGYFHVVDRRKDMIIRSGLKVYPAKLERVLRGHELVADVAVVGRADPVHTEEVVACIVLKNPSMDHTGIAVQLKAYCRKHLAPYEVPSKIEFLDSIPRSPLGKVLKKELRIAPKVEPAVQIQPAAMNHAVLKEVA